MLELEVAAAAQLDSGAGSEKLLAGVRLLDTWRDRAYGAVLFWVERELGLDSVLHVVHCELADGAWRSRGNAGATTPRAAEIVARRAQDYTAWAGALLGIPSG